MKREIGATEPKQTEAAKRAGEMKTRRPVEGQDRWRKEVEDSPSSEWEKTGRLTSHTGYLKGPGIGKGT